MNILLIGGTGVLSTAVTNEALKQGIKVSMINRGNRKKIIPNGVELFKADKNDKIRILSFLKGRHFDAVMDFLCYSEKETNDSFELYSNFTEQYFYISSCAVYDTRKGGLMSEDSPKVLPIWDYSVRKWNSEQKLCKLAENSNTHYTIIRPCVTYGDTRIPYGIAPSYGYHWTLIERIKNNKPIIRWNGGKNCCNMTRVEDFALGVVGLIGNPKAYDDAFNVCGDETPSWNDVIEILEDITQHKAILVDVSSDFYAKQVPEKAGEILGGRSIDSKNSNAKLKLAVPSFQQNISLKEGIKKTFDAYINNNYQYGIDYRFDGECDKTILNWCKSKGINASQYNIGFVDYLKEGGFKQHLTYLKGFYKNSLILKILSKLLH